MIFELFFQQISIVSMGVYAFDHLISLLCFFRLNENFQIVLRLEVNNNYCF